MCEKEELIKLYDANQKYIENLIEEIKEKDKILKEFSRKENKEIEGDG